MDSSIELFRSKLRAAMPRLREQYHVADLTLFGSRVRGDARDDSDLDILVTFDKTPSLLRFVNLENRLSDLLEVKVDLVLRRSLKPHVSQRILADLAPI